MAPQQPSDHHSKSDRIANAPIIADITLATNLLPAQGKGSTFIQPRYADGRKQAVARIAEPDIHIQLFRNVRVSAYHLHWFWKMNSYNLSVSAMKRARPTISMVPLMMHGPDFAVILNNATESLDKGIYLSGNMA